MAEYAIHFFCDECGKVHPLGIAVALDDGPAEKESIGNLYAGKELPERIGKVIGNMTTCPNTGKLTAQKDNNQVFLVAI